MGAFQILFDSNTTKYRFCPTCRLKVYTRDYGMLKTWGHKVPTPDFVKRGFMGLKMYKKMIDQRHMWVEYNRGITWASSSFLIMVMATSAHMPNTALFRFFP